MIDGAALVALALGVGLLSASRQAVAHRRRRRAARQPRRPRLRAWSDRGPARFGALAAPVVLATR